MEEPESRPIHPLRLSRQNNQAPVKWKKMEDYFGMTILSKGLLSIDTVERSHCDKIWDQNHPSSFCLLGLFVFYYTKCYNTVLGI